MATIRHRGTLLKLPNIKFERAGQWQPRFEPGPSLRRAGWTGYPLKDDQGRWLDRDAAVAKALAICADIEAWRQGRQPDIPAVQIHVKARTVGHLLQVYRSSDEFARDIKPATRRDYNRGLDAVVAAGLALDVRTDAVDKPVVKALYAKLRKIHGHASANHHMRVVARAWSIGVDSGVALADPFRGFRLKGVKPRVRFVEEAELQATIAAARRLGLHSLAAMLAVAVVTGQRQGDVNKFPINILSELDRLSATAHPGGHQLQQGKRSAIVQLPAPMLAMLRQLLTGQVAHARAAAKAKRPNTLPVRLFVRESTGQPYPDRNAINKDFRRARDEAAKTHPSVLGLDPDGSPMTDPETGEDISAALRFTFADLRDTALTRLVLSGCSIAEVCSITGHSLRSALDVWKHYLAIMPEMAEEAGRKVAAWCEQNGYSY